MHINSTYEILAENLICTVRFSSNDFIIHETMVFGHLGCTLQLQTAFTMVYFLDFTSLDARLTLVNACMKLCFRLFMIPLSSCSLQVINAIPAVRLRTCVWVDKFYFREITYTRQQLRRLN